MESPNFTQKNREKPASYIVGNVMTKTPVVIEAHQSLSAAQELMKHNHIHHLPVVSNGKAFSMLSQHEINLILSLETDDDKQQICVRDACALQVYKVHPNDSLKIVVDEMAAKRIGSALVVVDGVVVGIFTMVDACRVLADLLPNT